MGGATAKIGDPSGRKTERQEMLNSLIDDNVKGIKKNIETIFENHAKYFWKGESPLKPLV